MTDARKRMRFDTTAVTNYAERERKEKEAKQMNRLRPKLSAANVSVAASIAGSEYTKGVKNGKN